MNRYGKRIFFSYYRPDYSKVAQVAAELEPFNVQVWIDKQDIKPGDLWVVDTEHWIERCDVILVFVSKAALSHDGYYQKEVTLARKRQDKLPLNRRIIIPLLLESDCKMHPLLEDIHHLDLAEDDWLNILIEKLELDKNVESGFIPYEKREALIEQIEDDKKILRATWIRRNKFPIDSISFQSYEQKVLELANRIFENKRLLGEYFDSAEYYRGIRIETRRQKEEKHKNDKVYIDRMAVCVPRRYIGKYIYIVEKGKSPTYATSGDGRVVAHMRSFLDEKGKKQYEEIGDGCVNHRGIVKAGKEYDIYDDFNEGAYKIGTVTGIEYNPENWPN